MQRVLDARAASRMRLLLVDDTVAQRDLYEMMLEHEFAVSTANRGAEGIVKAVRDRPDVIVLDVMMPGLSGWDTCAEIKSHPATAHIPVILLTGTDDHDLSTHAVAVGAAALLRKPCPADTLTQTIRQVLGESARRATQDEHRVPY
jgi:CheY-like chemotaxis protein